MWERKSLKRQVRQEWYQSLWNRKGWVKQSWRDGKGSIHLKCGPFPWPESESLPEASPHSLGASGEKELMVLGHKETVVQRKCFQPGCEKPGGNRCCHVGIPACIPAHPNPSAVPFEASVRAQSCLTFCDPMNCSPPGSSVQGILQARILEWVAISYSRGSSRSRDGTLISCLTGRGICHSLPRMLPGTLAAGIQPAQGASSFGLTPLFCAKNLWESCVLRIIHEIRSVWYQSWEDVTWGKQEPPVGPHWVSGWPGSRPCTSSSPLVPPWPCYPLGSPSGLHGPDALGAPGFSLLSIYYFGGSVVKDPP